MPIFEIIEMKCRSQWTEIVLQKTIGSEEQVRVCISNCNNAMIDNKVQSHIRAESYVQLTLDCHWESSIQFLLPEFQSSSNHNHTWQMTASLCSVSDYRFCSWVLLYVKVIFIFLVISWSTRTRISQTLQNR